VHDADAAFEPGSSSGNFPKAVPVAIILLAGKQPASGESSSEIYGLEVYRLLLECVQFGASAPPCGHLLASG
jgi:hypothetical protein